jgi:hypothetical protein
MAQTKREPEGYERLIAALAHSPILERAAQEKRYQKSSWEHWGVALPKMDAAIRATVADLGQGDSLRLRRGCGASRCGISGSSPGGFWRARRSRPTPTSGRSSRGAWAISTAGRSPTISRSSAGAASSPTRRGSSRRKLGRQPAFVDAPRGAGLHPAVDQGRARSRAHARLGGATRPRPPMVHPEGDRLVAARTLQARSSARAPLPRRTGRAADGGRAARGDEISRRAAAPRRARRRADRLQRAAGGLGVERSRRP